MLKLPPYFLKEIEVDESDPFIMEALKPRKPYEVCWCGSGLKYKKCHRFREEERPLSLGQLLNRQRKVFWRSRGCMHPYASQTECNSKVIDAHSIQRKGALSKLVNRSNHVCHLELLPENYDSVVVEIGWRKASTFPGYCSKHDTSLFYKLETSQFSGTHEQCVIQSFRNVCNELYKKRALIESFEKQRMLKDRGRCLDEQINMQLSITRGIEAQSKSVNELLFLWNKFEEAIMHDKYDLFMSRSFFFKGDLFLTSASALHVEFDFSGNRLVNLWDLREKAEILIHSVMSTDQGGAIVFCWLKEHKTPEQVVSSFEAYADEDKGDVFVQYCFLGCENTFFSQTWWDQRKEHQKLQIKQLFQCSYYDGGAFIPNKDKLVDWRF